MRCPKCSSHMNGPVYEAGVYGERLRYRCYTCGYSTITATHDSNRTPNAHQWWIRDNNGTSGNTPSAEVE